MFYGRGTISIIYVNDVLLFDPDQYKVDEVTEELEDAGIQLTFEEDMYALLGVEVNTDNHSGKVTLTQGGFTKKVLNTEGMLYSNKKKTTEVIMPFVTDAEGPTFDKTCQYASVVVMLMYLYINPRLDIQFVVHHCARFIQNTRKSNTEIVKCICLYLVLTQGKVLTFTTNSDMKMDCYVDEYFQDFGNTRMTKILHV